MLVSFNEKLIQVRVVLKEEKRRKCNWENISTRLACEQLRDNFLLNDCCGWTHSTYCHTEWVIPETTKKQAGKVMRSKSVSSIPSWALYQFLTSSLRPWLTQWWTAKWNKTLPFQVSFSNNVLVQKKEP